MTAAAPAAPSPRTDTLAQSVAILLALTVVQRMIGFVRSVLFCRWIDVDQLGEWDLAFNFLMLAAPAAVIGLPGSFGRYVEHYRQQGQLRSFLGRTLTACFLLGSATVAIVALKREWFSQLLFGSVGHVDVVLALAAALAAVILFNTLWSLFAALRQYRAASAMQFLNTLLFAVVSLALLVLWHTGTATVVASIGIAYAASALVAVVLLVRQWHTLPNTAGTIEAGSLWRRLLPFAFWGWITNWVVNLFEIVDRFLIVHYSGLDSVAALDMVGQYHSARVIPLLFLGVAELLGPMITPHLSHDWEAGRRAQVSERLSLVLKVLGLAFTGVSVVVLLAAPFMFHIGFRDKFAGGEAVLPWALAGCIWTGMVNVMANYLWCAEKPRLVSLTWFISLVLNVGLNLWLLPRYGLMGAVVATAAARLLSMVVLWWFSKQHGMRVDAGLVAVALLPLLLALGPWPTIAVGLALVGGLLPWVRCFCAAERDGLIAALRGYVARRA